MAQHVGTHNPKPSTPSDLLHDSCERAARQWPVRFDADEVHTFQKPHEFDLCCRVRRVLRIAEPLAMTESVDAVISPMSNPCFLVKGDVSFLLRNDVLEQIPAPPSAQILTDGAGSWQTEVDDTLLAFRSHWYPTACKVNVLDADHGHLTDAASCRVEQLNQCSVSRMRGSPQQFLDLRLSQRSRQFFNAAPRAQESRSNAVHDPAHIEKIKKAS